MVIAAAAQPALFDALVVAHVACAVVGFGAVAISGVYGGSTRHTERPGTIEEAGRYFRSRARAEWLVLAVPFLGLAALAARRGPSELDQAWVVAAAGVWLLAAATLLCVVRPAERQLRTLLAGSEHRGAPGGIKVAGRQLMLAAAASDVLFVVALALMVNRPA